MPRRLGWPWHERSGPLIFTGYVKVVGTFNNFAFCGTFSPGLSPTLMTVGNTLQLRALYSLRPGRLSDQSVSGAGVRR